MKHLKGKINNIPVLLTVNTWSIINNKFYFNNLDKFLDKFMYKNINCYLTKIKLSKGITIFLEDNMEKLEK